jgi:prevent-host-death family protein
MQVNILEAKNRLSQLIKSAQAGEEVIIANRGEPVARLVPAGKAAVTAAESGKGRAVLDWLSTNPLPDHARRSAAEIDASIREERESWE